MKNPSVKQLANLADNVLRASEHEDIVHALRNLVETMGATRASSETVGGGGEIDMLISDWAVVVECKSEGIKDFRARGTGSRPGESAIEQLDRYHADLEETDKFAPQKGKWLGVITNGTRWLTRTWESGKSTDFSSQRDFTDNSAALVEWMSNVLKQRRRYNPLPDDPHKIFAPYCDRLISIGDSNWSDSDKKVYTTQRELWEELLRGSGMGVPVDKNTLFRRHCFLISLARAVEASMESDPPSDINDRTEGFISWMGTVPEGIEYLEKIYSAVLDFDWRSSHRDVLREIYQETIDKKERHAFGEYYTPDWLAEMIVEKVLNDAWLSRSIEALDGPVDGYGVLDPACGSGTFLFHAAKRIYRYLEEKGPRLPTDNLRADIVANLVAGIDIHPVAVELAQINLLRSFPRGVMPTRGRNSLRIIQGDALLAEWRQVANGGQRQLLNNPDTDDRHYRFQFPSTSRNGEKSIEYSIPKFLAKSPSFQQNLKLLVDAAIKQHDTPQIPGKFTSEEQIDLKESFIELKELVKQKSNGIWAWHIYNSISPLLLSENKVDRIIANPPWVRMSAIQDDRKAVVKGLLEDSNLWEGGDVATSTDIASLFVCRIGDRYMTGSRQNYDSGWVLPWGALRGSNWARARDRLRIETLDLSEVSQSPFSNNYPCCVWYEKARGGKMINKQAQNKVNQKIDRQRDAWEQVEQKIAISTVKTAPISPSGYCIDNSSVFFQGATLVPHVLTKVAEEKKSGNRSNITTFKSIHRPWNVVNPMSGEIPAKWIKNVCTQDLLLPFKLNEPDVKFIIPVDGKNQLILDEKELMKETFWKELDNTYKERKGKGDSTPISLIENINFRNKLLPQFQRSKGWIVIYNASGAYLRSARSNDDKLLFNHKLYWHTCTSKEEAGYLVTLLNSNYLLDSFKYARESLRGYDTHIWKKVPIPKFDSNNRSHLKIAELCSKAEELVSGLPSEYIDSSQSIASAKIRKKLIESCLATEIDKAVEKVIKI